MAALPDGFFENGGHLRIFFGGEVTELSVSLKLPVAAKHHGYNIVAARYETDHKLTIDWRRLCQEHSLLNQKREKAKLVANGVLEHCNTLK